MTSGPLSSGLTRAASRRIPIAASGALRADTAAFIARMSVQPNAARTSVIDKFFADTAALRSNLDCLYLLAAHDAQAARLNLIGSSYALTEINAPTFTADRGYKGNGTSSLLDSGFNPATAGGKLVQNSAHTGAWLHEDVSLGGGFAVGNLNTALAPHQGTSGAETAQLRLNAAATATTGVYTRGTGRHYAQNRTAAATVDFWAAGAKRLTAFAQTSAAPSSQSLTVCGRQTGAAAYQYDTRRIAAAHWGASLTDAEHSALYSALQTYMTAVGAA